MRARRAVPAAAAAALALAGAAPAVGQAAQVVVESPPCADAPRGGPDCSAVLAFVAAPGEINRVTVRRDAGGAIVFHDGGAPVSGCTAVDAATVRCEAVGTTAVRLGDGDDDVTVEGPLSVAASGGDGADRLTGAEAADRLDGGPGDDVLLGGAGDDALDGGPGTDSLDGGDGADAASYAERRGPITADLRAGTGGEGGREDVLAGLELLVGGAGDDVLAGTNGPETLDGGPGDDRLYGRGGDDELDGRAGDDRLTGGTGDDLLDAGGSRLSRPDARERDTAVCGAGRDEVQDVLPAARVAGDCELVGPEGADTDLLLALTSRPRPLTAPLLRLRSYTCDAGVPGGRCRTQLRIRTALRVLAARTVVLRDERPARGASLRLDGAGRRALRGARRIAARVELRGGGCAYAVCGFRTTLRAP